MPTLRPVQWRRAAVTALVALFCNSLLPTPALAQDMEVPVAIQVPLFLKVLSFDRRLTARAERQLVVAVVFQSGFGASVEVKNEVLRMLASATTTNGRGIRAVEVNLDRESLPAALARERVTLLYVAPLRGADIQAVAAASRNASVTTVTGVPRYVAQGLSVGVRLQGDRPKLLINVNASRLEGADFTAELLKLAQTS